MKFRFWEVRPLACAPRWWSTLFYKGEHGDFFLQGSRMQQFSCILQSFLKTAQANLTTRCSSAFCKYASHSFKSSLYITWNTSSSISTGSVLHNKITKKDKTICYQSSDPPQYFALFASYVSPWDVIHCTERRKEWDSAYRCRRERNAQFIKRYLSKDMAIQYTRH